jgi:uncharacterized protein
MRDLTRDDIEALAIGAAIFGTGGGGDPYIDTLRCLEMIDGGARIPLIELAELEDEACVYSVGGVGAPGVSIEKLEQGEENLRALHAVEREVGRRADCLIAGEIGGANALGPIITAAQAGIGLVDGDGMGRAFPEMQMTTFSIYGQSSVPAAIADDKGNVVVFRNVVDELTFERLTRACVVEMGGTAGSVTAPMTGRYVKRVAVPATVSRAISLGRIVLEANLRHEDPVPLICRAERGTHLLDGKIVDLQRSFRGGFAVGEIVIEGSGVHKGDRARILFQNEFLLFSRNDAPEVTVPDLIVVVDIDSGHAIATESLRFGQRVAVLSLPCDPLLRSPEALAVVGPAAFRLAGVEYRPTV